jgi:hypothetical protein
VTDTGSRAVSALRWCDAERVRTPWRAMVLSEDRTNLQRSRGVWKDMIIYQRDFPGAKLPRRKFFHLAASAAELPAISLARAQTYPSRPISILVLFPAGAGEPIPGAKLGGLHVCSEASQWRAKIWL